MEIQRSLGKQPAMCAPPWTLPTATVYNDRSTGCRASRVASSQTVMPTLHTSGRFKGGHPQIIPNVWTVLAWTNPWQNWTSTRIPKKIQKPPQNTGYRSLMNLGFYGTTSPQKPGKPGAEIPASKWGFTVIFDLRWSGKRTYGSWWVSRVNHL